MENCFNLIPFGKVYKDRIELSKKYNLIEQVVGAGIWRLTKKCTSNYDPVSFIYYLQGKTEKPKRVGNVPKTTRPQQSLQEEIKSTKHQQIINEILSL